MYALEIAALIALAGLVLVAWQYQRHLRARRHCAEDDQPLLCRPRAFHLLVYFRVPDGERVVETARQFWQRVRGAGPVRLVYAGQAVFTAGSGQLPHNEWSGLVVLQYPSRAALEAPAVQSQLSRARELFANSYLHGMHRNTGLGLLMPLALLGIRSVDLLHGRWRWPPMEKLPAFDTFPRYDDWRQRITRLRAAQTINPGGLVAWYLVRKRNPRELPGDREHSSEMLSRMAALGYGPLHIGRSQALEGDAQFDHVFAVHYPSAAYFAELVSSGFYQHILYEQYRLDSVSVPTVPVTAQVA